MLKLSSRQTLKRKNFPDKCVNRFRDKKGGVNHFGNKKVCKLFLQQNSVHKLLLRQKSESIIFQTIQKLLRPPGHFPDYLESFHII